MLGLGDNVVDKYMDTGIMYPGGQALNFAIYVKMLGAQSAYLGVFGNDYVADFVSRTALSMGVSLDHCPRREGENGYACVTHENGDRIFLYSNKGGVSREQPLVLGPTELEYIKGFDLVHTSSNGRVDSELSKIKEIGVPVSYDFSNKMTDQMLKTICPDITFAVMSCGHLSEDGTKDMIAQAHRYGAKYVLATRGEEGSYFSDGNEIFSHEAYFVTPLDTLGAGDSYASAFMVSFVGFMKENPDYTHEQFVAAVQAAMDAGSRFAAKNVMVNGAFGHGIPIPEDQNNKV